MVKEVYEVIEEGIFYADDLPSKGLSVLKDYRETAVPDVRTFPPRFPLHSRSKFMKKVFWRTLKREGAMVVGFNLGYLVHKLAFLKDVYNVPKNIASTIEEINALRNAMAHAFFPENLRAYQMKGRPAPRKPITVSYKGLATLSNAELPQPAPDPLPRNKMEASARL